MLCRRCKCVGTNTVNLQVFVRRDIYFYIEIFFVHLLFEFCARQVGHLFAETCFLTDSINKCVGKVDFVD